MIKHFYHFICFFIFNKLLLLSDFCMVPEHIVPFLFSFFRKTLISFTSYFLLFPYLALIYSSSKEFFKSLLFKIIVSCNYDKAFFSILYVFQSSTNFCFWQIFVWFLNILSLFSFSSLERYLSSTRYISFTSFFCSMSLLF